MSPDPLESARTDFRAQQRREDRVPCDKEITIIVSSCEPDLESRKVRLLDWSSSGIGFVSPEPMRPEDQFIVVVSLDAPISLQYTVRHCAPVDQGFRVGAKFDGPVGNLDQWDHDAIALVLAANF